MIKRAFDVIVSALGLVILSPLLISIAALVRFSSAGPVIFKQIRIGRNFEPFQIYKFRTMVSDAPARGPAITSGHDPRITPIGRLLRKTKLDELPQLVNVLKGEMSFVGPRPEVPKYVDLFRDRYANVLRVRPGITDLASVRFRHESDILAKAEDSEAEYCRRVLPHKLRLANVYIKHASFCFDMRLIAHTFLSLFSLKY